MWPPIGEPTIYNAEGSARRLLDSIGVDSRTPSERRRDTLQNARVSAYQLKTPIVPRLSSSEQAIEQQEQEAAEAALETGPSQSIGLNLPG